MASFQAGIVREAKPSDNKALFRTELRGADSLRPSQSKDFSEDVRDLTRGSITSPKDRASAAEGNIAMMQQALRCLMVQVILVLGGTGTGKTTSFMMSALRSAPGKKWLLVVPTRSLVKNCVQSVAGLLRVICKFTDCTPDEDDSHVDPVLLAQSNCVIHAITEDNQSGWKTYLDRAYDPKKAMLVIMTSSMFGSTMEYWLDNGYTIMYDEPDDKSCSATSPTALNVVHKVKQRSHLFTLPANTNPSSLKEAQRVFGVLLNMWLDAGNSYNESPTTLKEYRMHIGRLVKSMRPTNSIILFSTATMPSWLTTAICNSGLRQETIVMKKPPNVSGTIYLQHFDPLVAGVIETNSMESMYSPIGETLADIIKFIHRATSSLSFSPGDMKIQMRRAHHILLVMPGMHEVSCMVKILQPMVDGNHPTMGKVIIMTPNNRDKMMHMIEESPLSIIVVEVIPGHEARGMNFNAGTIVIPPFNRYRTVEHNTTQLHVLFMNMASLLQAEGRAGRMGPCLVVLTGSKKMYNSLEQENLFTMEGVDDMILLWVSKGLSVKEFMNFDKMFAKSTELDLAPKMTFLIEQGFITVENEHYNLSRSGKLFNIFHEQLDEYLSLEDYLFRTQSMGEVMLLKLLVWLQLSQNMQSGKNTLFKFPEGQGIRVSMQESRDSVAEGTRIESQCEFMWLIVQKVFELVSEYHDGDLDSLFRYQTYNARSQIGLYLIEAHLNPDTIRLCCINAINQRNRILKNGLMEGLEAYGSKPFVMQDYLVEMTLKALSENKMQVAVQIPTEKIGSRPGVHIYADSNGNYTMVSYDLIHPPFDGGKVIIVMRSVVKPGMKQKRLGLGTMTFPMTLLSKHGDIYSMMMDRHLDDELVRLVRTWLQSGGEPPFSFIENCDDLLDAISFSLITGEKMNVTNIDPLVFSLLKALVNMKEQAKTLDENAVRGMFDFFARMFKEHSREMLSTSGGTDTPHRQMRGAYVEIGGILSQFSIFNKCDVRDTSRDTAFMPWVIIQQYNRKKAHCFQPQKFVGKRYNVACSEMTPFQRLNYKSTDENKSIVDGRRDRYVNVSKRLDMRQVFPGFGLENIKSRPCCTICGTVDMHDEVELVYVRTNKLSKLETRYDSPMELLMPFHSQCLKDHVDDPDFGDFCPYTGGQIFSSGIKYCLADSPEQKMYTVKWLFVMSDEDGLGFIRNVLAERVDNVNKLLGQTFDKNTIEQMCPIELADLHKAYAVKIEETLNAQRKREQGQKRALELDRSKIANAERQRLKVLEDKRKALAKDAKASRGSPKGKTGRK